MGHLVWLFREHREVVEERNLLERQNLQLQHQLADLERQLLEKPVEMSDLRAEMDKLFSEAPFPNNEVPESMWLTPPGEGEYARNR